MHTLTTLLFSRRRLILTLAFTLTALGSVAWLAMDRQEDPFFPYRYGTILVPYPGAEPEQVERLVLNALEEELAQIEEVDDILGTARLGLAQLEIGMHQHVYDTDHAWQRIRVAVDRASRKFPDGVGAPEVLDRETDSHGITLAVTGSQDLLVLRDAAERLRRDLFRHKSIARIDLLADPGQQVTVTWDDAIAERTGLDARALGGQLAARNRTVPAGTLTTGGRSVVLYPATEFTSLDELTATPIRLANGTIVPLGELADVSLTPSEPATERFWFNGRPAVALGIVLPDNRINTVRFGGELRALVDELRPAYAPLQIHEAFFQPDWVAQRLSELGFSLLLGIVVVTSILVLVMGWRLGVTVALIIPLVTFSALAVYAIGGGVLHQIAIAGMVISIGMLVDNAIVVAENVQWHRDRGATAGEAATLAIRELAAPLFAATGTTLAAFAPLLLSRGDTADFTRAIPVMVMLTLGVSYLFAVFVTPLFAGSLLRARGTVRAPQFQRGGERLGRFAVHRPGIVLALAALLLTGAAAMAPLLDHEFFPGTDRNQLVIDLYLPQGTHLDHTAHHATALADTLRREAGVERTYVFAGSGGPRFYYNLALQLRQPNFARLVVETDTVARLPGLMDRARDITRVDLPEADVAIRRLGQGPPVEAPIEIRLYSADLAALAEAARQVQRVVRSTPGALDVRHRLGEGLVTLRAVVDDARAAEFGLSREHVAEALAGASHGLEVTTWRAGRDPAPLLIRSTEGERFPPAALDGLRLPASNGDAVPLAQIATLETRWQPAVILHRDLRRTTSVLAEVADGHTYARILDQVVPRLTSLRLPEGVSWSLGGAAESAGDANSALTGALPLGVLLLVVFLLAQFNSFRLLLIVLSTVPLAAVGVIPGLYLTGQPFSFTAVLGVIALVGIVVNNAIVLIDVMNRNRAAGMTLDDAVIAAVGRRARPVLLTSATTIAGLMPLTFTHSTLWPPMAWAIIWGLTSSTLLTLVVTPALYRLALARTAAP